MSSSRRHFLRGLLAIGAGSIVPFAPGRMARSGEKVPKHLIVIAGFGGASIIDSFLPIAASESSTPDTLNTFADSDIVNVAGSPIRTVGSKGSLFGITAPGDLPQFLADHKDSMMVTTSTVSSVNHVIGQKRSMTGGGAMHGRTLAECVAAEYGEGYSLPNVNMASLGYLEPGADDSLPSFARHEPVSAPLTFALGLSGERGILGAPADTTMDLARAMRKDRIDPDSTFYKTFQKSERLARFLGQRDGLLPVLEDQNLFNNLNLLGPSDGPGGTALDLSAYGVEGSSDTALVRSVFPALSYDPLEAQAALAFLLIKNRVSVAVTIGPNFNVTAGGGDQGLVINPPLSFDFSHSAHRSTQSFMWGRLTSVIGRLIGLLKGAELDPKTGQSFWDRTMIHVATDFGRSKTRPPSAAEFGTGHDLNNGNLTLAPFIKGNSVLGGVNADTAETFGFDVETGAPIPGKQMEEGEIFMGLLGALDIPTSGGLFPDVPAMRG